MNDKQIREKLLEDLHGAKGRVNIATFSRKHGLDKERVLKIMMKLEDEGLCAID